MNSNFSTDSGLPVNIWTQLTQAINLKERGEKHISASRLDRYLASAEGKDFLSQLSKSDLLDLKKFLQGKSNVRIIAKESTKNFPPILKQASKLGYQILLLTGKALHANDVYHYRRALVHVEDELFSCNRSRGYFS